jgi:hypothetical protein
MALAKNHRDGAVPNDRELTRSRLECWHSWVPLRHFAHRSPLHIRGDSRHRTLRHPVSDTGAVAAAAATAVRSASHSSPDRARTGPTTGTCRTADGAKMVAAEEPSVKSRAEGGKPSRRDHVLTLEIRRNLRGICKSWPHGGASRGGQADLVKDYEPKGVE